jgi:hypothetical protein
MPDAAAHKLQETVDQITWYRRRTRKLVVGLIAVTAVSILVAALAVYLFFRVHDSDVGNCAAGNQTRAQQLQLWNDLFVLSAEDATARPTAKTQRLVGEFLGDVKKTYAPVDCSKRYPFW